VSRPRRQQLTIRLVEVHDPNAAETRDRVLDLLADALAEMAIQEARAEVAARLGVTPESIDREAGMLDPSARAYLADARERGAA
jgi:truncated hemoglobin YjbI